jgi:hypothetical protein
MTDRLKERAKQEQLDSAYHAMRKAIELLPSDTPARERALLFAADELRRTIVYLRRHK